MSKCILIVEDEKPLLEIVKTRFDEAGYEVVTARSVEQATNYLEEHVNIDAIWLDHYLVGKESGLDFVAKLKNDEAQWRNIPIFVVSNTASPDNVQSYLRFGVSKYYTKSDYKLSQIVDDVKDFLEKGENS